jgi:hypothetical protein
VAHRILFFSKRKRRTLYTSFIVAALRRIGCEVVHVDLGARRRWLGRALADRSVRSLAGRFRPDAALVFSKDILEETFDWLGERMQTAVLLDDYFPLDHPVTSLAKRSDVFFHTMEGQLEEYRAAGVRNPVYVHSGVDPERHRRVAPSSRHASDLAFIGKAAYPERIDLITRLHADFDIRVYGRGWREYGIAAQKAEIALPEFRKVCASARIIVGSDKTADRELYFSNRTWFVLGCGGFLLTRYVPGLERLFANHEHLCWFHDADEARELARFYLAQEDARRTIAEAGHRFAHAHYPFDRMARNLVRVLFEGGVPEPLTDPGPGRSPGGSPRESKGAPSSA